MLIKTGLFISWKLNQEYIIENLCINKNKPELECNGKCHLQSQLDQVDADKSNSHNGIPVKIKTVKIDESLPITPLICSAVFKVEVINNYLPHSYYSFNYSQNCFHPPQV